MTKEYQDYLQSAEWAEIKIDLISISGSNCQRCDKKRQPKYLHVHHKTYKNIFNEQPEDLELLCGSCHANEHGIVIKPKEPKNGFHMRRFLKRKAGGKFKTEEDIKRGLKYATRMDKIDPTGQKKLRFKKKVAKI